MQPFGHKRNGSKIGGCAPFGEGKLGPHLTQCRLGRGLPPYHSLTRVQGTTESRIVIPVYLHHTREQRLNIIWGISL